MSKKQREQQIQKQLKKREQDRLKKQFSRKKHKETKEKEVEIHIPEISKEEFSKQAHAFDEANENLNYGYCQACKQVRLGMKTMKINFQNGLLNCCGSCKFLSWADIEQQRKCLPTWVDKNGKVQYHVPEELACLREGEKLLIQRLNVYVPVYHLYMGQTAAKGHCAAFRQDLGRIANTLPRLPKEVNFVQVIKKYKNKDGDIGEKHFVIRKKAVLTALYWLKEHNHLYKDVTIEENRLDWMDNDESELKNDNNITDLVEDPESPELHDDEVINGIQQRDVGPAHSQVVAVEEIDEDEHLKQHGIVCEGFGVQPEQNMDETTSKIQMLAKQANKQDQPVNFSFRTKKQKEKEKLR